MCSQLTIDGSVLRQFVPKKRARAAASAAAIVGHKWSKAELVALAGSRGGAKTVGALRSQTVDQLRSSIGSISEAECACLCVAV